MCLFLAISTTYSFSVVCRPGVDCPSAMKSTSGSVHFEDRGASEQLGMTFHNGLADSVLADVKFVNRSGFFAWIQSAF